jgi:L-seryl-tRNA(Ser) seleniumtransferase
MLAIVEAAFRALPQSVIGHIRDNAFRLDLHCLEAKDEGRFIEQLHALRC